MSYLKQTKQHQKYSHASELDKTKSSYKYIRVTATIVMKL